MFDCEMNWNEHMTYVCTKLSRVMLLLRRLLKSEVSLQFFGDGLLLTLPQPCEPWHMVVETLLDVKEFLTLSRQDAHCRPLFQELGILTVYGQYVLSSLVYIKENVSSFSTRTEVHSYNVRSKCNLDFPRCRLTKTRDNFPHSAIRMYNSLP